MEIDPGSSQWRRNQNRNFSGNQNEQQLGYTNTNKRNRDTIASDRTRDHKQQRINHHEVRETTSQIPIFDDSFDISSDEEDDNEEINFLG